MKRLKTSIVVAIVAIGLAACSTAGVLDRDAGPLQARGEASALQKAEAQFEAGNFGKAALLYQTSIKENGSDPNAWLGLAASYDQTGRFDLADRAYHRAEKLLGANVILMNNRGYSYMLRGDLKRARDELARAHTIDGENVHLLNNVALLNERLAAEGRQVLVLP